MVSHGSFLITLFVSAVGFILVLWVGLAARPVQHAKLFLAGLAASLFGSLAYPYGFDAFYGGEDYNLYFTQGAEYASLLAEGNWERAASAWMSRENRWGTSFVIHVTGLLLSLVGPTLPGAFMIYGLAGFAGLLCFWRAARSAFPALDQARYLAWLVLFPSLCFWPTSLGKDALVLCGVGLAALGFAERYDLAVTAPWMTELLTAAAGHQMRPVLRGNATASQPKGGPYE